MKKYIAQIIIETKTPLVVGSGKSALDNDEQVARDWNNLPYIPGTGILGVISSLFKENFETGEHFEIFGGEVKDSKKDKDTFNGAKFEISDALLIDYDDNDNYGKVHQQLVKDLSKYHKRFLKLPKREHVKIDDKGVAVKNGKFDTEFVYKGARFKFEIELQGDSVDKYWDFILNSFYSNDFFLGSGTTNGYGQIEVKEIKWKTYDLAKKEEFIAYLNHNVDLNIFDDAEKFEKDEIKNNWRHNVLKLSTDAIHIGAGYGDTDVDDANYKEYVIEWDANDKPEWNLYFVIPGTSVKGAVSHRVAYNFNKTENITIEDILENAESIIIEREKEKLNQYFSKTEVETQEIVSKIESVDNLEDPTKKIERLQRLKQELKDLKEKINSNNNDNKIKYEPNFSDYILENNPAVNELFGVASNETNKKGKIGNIIFNDIYVPANKVSETIFQHNSIDRFTSGTLDTALFGEKVFSVEDIILEYYTNGDVTNKAFTDTLKEIQSSDLAIGGKTTKGYGYFK